jgi:glycosyltransferase involved in cell wall biosynthesis
MKIMHVIDSMGRGGAEWLLVEQIRLAAPDVESWVVAVNRGGAALDAARTHGAKVLVLDKGKRRWECIRRLARLMREAGIDVVNGHNPVGGLYAALASIEARGTVVFRTEHSVHYRGRHSVVYPLLEACSTALTRRVVCGCQAILESHVRRMPWAARRFVTVTYGISSAPHTRARDLLRQELGVGPEDRVALTIGRLAPAKAHTVMIEAFAAVAARVPQAVLLIVGEGPLRPELEAEVARRGLGGRVRLLGVGGESAELVKACDLFVLSSVREGLPVSILEAMRAGRAVVATDVGGTGEAVEDGATGRLVPARDPGALAAALEDLLGNPERLERFGVEARRRWEQRFTAERMVSETERLYRSELGFSSRLEAAEVVGGSRASS